MELLVLFRLSLIQLALLTWPRYVSTKLWIKTFYQVPYKRKFSAFSVKPIWYSINSRDLSGSILIGKTFSIKTWNMTESLNKNIGRTLLNWGVWVYLKVIANSLHAKKIELVFKIIILVHIIFTGKRKVMFFICWQ